MSTWRRRCRWPASDRTRPRLEIWADPTLTRNTHHVEVDADTARFSMAIEGIPSVETRATGRIVPLSVIAGAARAGLGV